MPQIYRWWWWHDDHWMIESLGIIQWSIFSRNQQVDHIIPIGSLDDLLIPTEVFRDWTHHSLRFLLKAVSSERQRRHTSPRARPRLWRLEIGDIMGFRRFPQMGIMWLNEWYTIWDGRWLTIIVLPTFMCYTLIWDVEWLSNGWRMDVNGNTVYSSVNYWVCHLIHKPPVFKQF